MGKYIIRDMVSMLHLCPYAIASWFFMAFLLKTVKRGRAGKGEKPWGVFAAASFYTYVGLLLTITFFSREKGSGNGIDLVLFSTWGINNRNNAYVIENILLFIPYGFVCAWYLEKGFFFCSLLGAVTSLGIECLQLFTHRGVFQIDDILTNMLGSMIGCLLCRLFLSTRKKDQAVR